MADFVLVVVGSLELDSFKSVIDSYSTCVNKFFQQRQINKTGLHWPCVELSLALLKFIQELCSAVKIKKKIAAL